MGLLCPSHLLAGWLFLFKAGPRRLLNLFKRMNAWAAPALTTSKTVSVCVVLRGRVRNAQPPQFIADRSDVIGMAVKGPQSLHVSDSD